jgi:hypothetical protein
VARWETKGWVSNRLRVSDTPRYPDLKRGRRHVSKDASCVKEWFASGLPNAVRRRDVFDGRDAVHGTEWRMSSREAIRVE